MTKRRAPLTFHRALTQIAARIGWDHAGAICGVTDRTVRYWSDPDCETEIRLIDAERLDRAFLAAGGDHPPFHRVYAQRLELAAHDAAACDLSQLAGRTARETGEAVAAMIAAAGSASPATRRRAREEVAQAIEALTSSMAALDERARA